MFGESIKKSLKKIAQSIGITDREIDELIRELQRELIRADVGVKEVLEITKTIKERIKKEDRKGLTKKEFIIHILYDELTKLLGKESREIVIDKKPFKIMLLGLFGSGKTTTAAKLAKYYQKRGYSVLLIQTDTYRPAAGEQLTQLGKKIGVKTLVIPREGNYKDPMYVANWYKSIEKEIEKKDIVIIDTAGRDSLSEELIEEIKNLKDVVQPNEAFLVISADIGKTAKQQAIAFNEAVGITGIIVTKMDGTARAGGALVAAVHTNAKVVFIGTGESIDDLEKYDPKRFASRLLGMGDLESLLEKAQEVIDKEKAEKIGQRFLKGEFTLIDMYEQLESMQKMGPLKKVLSMIPGISLSIPDELVENQEEKMKKWRYIMQSMTKQELEDPTIIDYSRIKRISMGSGVDEKEITQLISQYKKMKKLMKNIKSEKDIQKMMKKMGLRL